jgi:CDP-diacylglycerol--glycerol-3-phosphate 3-phosphatidyltransferase
MRITANQVTYARLLMLPLPVWMMYQGYNADAELANRPLLMGSLAIFVLLGLTDALDGWLARKHGSTPIGALLDPVADKIFLVCAFVPMSDLRMVPPALVMIVFFRELGVTFLRSLALEERFEFKTSAAAKLKTTVQMAGAGYILLFLVFPKPEHIFPILGVSVAGSLVPAVVALARGRRPGWMAISSAVWFTAVLVARWLFAPHAAVAALMVAITALTLLSGLEYFWGMRAVLARRFAAAPIDALRFAGLSLVLPLLFIPALDRTGAPTITILVLLAAEVAAGGLENSLAQNGRGRGPIPDLLRCAVQAAAGVGVVLLLEGNYHPTAARAAAGVALAVTLADFGARLVRNRDIFR